MSRIFIFGDSFSIETRKTRNTLRWVKTFCKIFNTHKPIGWSSLISDEYETYNYSIGGASCSSILKKLKIAISKDNITPTDFIIICWSDKNRDCTDFLNQDWKQLVSSYYTAILQETKLILSKNKFNYVVVWGFPSEYGIDKNCWTSDEFLYIDKDNYEYSVSFDNEIRPALIYYSRQEFRHVTGNDGFVKIMGHGDNRPNHINSQQFHNELKNTVVKFINKEISGCINLDKVCNE